jgi:uncharacterized protein (TIGR02145 family)
LEPKLTTIVTDKITNISPSTANANGHVKIRLYGEFALIAYGVCWNTSPNPSLSNNITTDSIDFNNLNTNSFITNLNANTTYYVRAYATNIAGTSYGNQVMFKTREAFIYGTVKDIEGNVYKTIKIGNQIWMAENLKTTKYRNGDEIPNKTTSWPSNLSTGACCNFDNNVENVIKYGKLYNWYAVSDKRGLAPEGWHVPSESEWRALENYLITNGYEYFNSYSATVREVGRNQLSKSLAANTDWSKDTSIGTPGNDLSRNNSSGFTALPAGSRSQYGGSFRSIGLGGFWWSSTEDYYQNEDFAFNRGIWNSSQNLLGQGYTSLNGYRVGISQRTGMSVRCIKN